MAAALAYVVFNIKKKHKRKAKKQLDKIFVK